jgi:hypothetical protein
MNKLDPVDVFKKVIYGPFYQTIIIQTLYKLLMKISHNKSFFAPIHVLIRARIGYSKFRYPRVILQPKFGYGLGLCLNSMGIFRLGTQKLKVQKFGYFWVLIIIDTC